MNRIQKIIAIRKKFEQEFSDDELVTELCDTIVSLLDNHNSEKEWFDTVIFKSA